MIDHLYKSGYTVQSKTETPNAGGVVVDSYATAFANVLGHMRTATKSELAIRQKDEVISTHVFYTDVRAITNRMRVVNPDGEVFEIDTVDNPHNLDKFLVVRCSRSDYERESDA